MRGPDAYPTVSGVAAAARLLTRRHPDLCRMRPAGESRAGQPLWLLSVGRGSRHVLVVAGAHPDGQVGGTTVLHLAEQAVHDRRRLADTDLTWDFLLCLDPDALVRNEIGPAGERPPAVHYRHSFRPAAADQAERPGDRGPGGGLPETRALLAVIDELRPALQCTLHGTDVGGASVRLTRDLPGLAEPFGKYAAELDVPVPAAGHDVPRWNVAGPGVFVLPAPGAAPAPAGRPERTVGATWYRPHRHGGATVQVEVPAWASRKVADTDPHPDPEQALSALESRLRKDGIAIDAALDRAVALLGRSDEPVPRGIEDAARGFTELADDCAALAVHSPVPLTMGHIAALDISVRRLPLSASGMLLRLLHERDGGLDADPNGERARLRSRLERRLDAGARDLVSVLDARWLPVGVQAELQARTVLAAVDLLG